MTENAPTPPPGWYPDPQNQSEQRWWDGTAWGTAPAPRQLQPVKGATSRIVWGSILLAFGALQVMNFGRLALIGESSALAVALVAISSVVFGVLLLVRGIERRRSGGR